MFSAEWHACNDKAQRAFKAEKQLLVLRAHNWKKREGDREYRRQDGECDSDHRVSISRKVAQEAGNSKTQGHMVQRFPYEASHTTRNLFTRWLSGCNATNLGLMKNTGAECQQRGLSTIPKRIFESPDVPCIEFDSTLFIPAGLLKGCIIRLYTIYRAV